MDPDADSDGTPMTALDWLGEQDIHILRTAITLMQDLMTIAVFQEVDIDEDTGLQSFKFKGAASWAYDEKRAAKNPLMRAAAHAAKLGILDLTQLKSKDINEIVEAMLLPPPNLTAEEISEEEASGIVWIPRRNHISSRRCEDPFALLDHQIMDETLWATEDLCLFQGAMLFDYKMKTNRFMPEEACKKMKPNAKELVWAPLDRESQDKGLEWFIHKHYYDS